MWEVCEGQKVLAPFADVRNYGAVGNGIADDRIAIQTAIDDCYAAGGGVIYIPPGIYRLTMTTHPDNTAYNVCLMIPSNVHLMGAGIDATTLKLANTSAYGSVMLSQHFDKANPISNVIISDLTIDGNAANQSGIPTASPCGISSFRQRYTHIQQVKIKDVYGTGGSGVQEGFGFDATESADIFYEGCIAVRTSGNTSSGFGANGSSNIHYSNCSAAYMGTGIANTGIGLTHNNCAQVQYVNCQAYLNNYIGFNSEVSNRVSYSNCIAGGKASSDANAVFAANAELGNGTYGFVLNGSSYVQIMGGASRNSAGNGITLANACDSIVVEGLDLNGNVTTVGTVGAASTNVSITNCPGYSFGSLGKLADLTLAADKDGGEAGGPDFPGLPPWFSSLRIEIYARSTRVDVQEILLIKVNNDGGANYDSVTAYLRHNGAYSTAETIGGTTAYGHPVPAASAPANSFGSGTLKFPNYANATNHKPFHGDGFHAENTTSTNIFYTFAAGIWKSTAAINRITFLSQTGAKFKAGSRFVIYGEP